MRVFPVGLVLDEETRPHDLANIVIQHRHTREKGVASDDFSAGLR